LLYWLLYQKLFPFFHPFRIFHYLTFRTAFASLTAMLIALLIGPFVIEKLRSSRSASTSAMRDRSRTRRSRERRRWAAC
jgi:hypothetical protein